ncbi:MAG: OmpA/MotB family protein [Fibrobacterota bacterium]
MSLRKQKNRNRIIEGGEADPNGWLQTYSDMITLLMAFFIILIRVSEVDPMLWEQLKKGLRSEILNKETETPLAEIKHDLDSLLRQERADSLVNIDFDRNGIWMTFASAAFYEAGSANVQQQAQTIIDKVIVALNNITYYNFNIDVQGHTDDLPINTARFPSNWELSVSRATNIVKYMIERGIEAERLKAAGYADTKPVKPNVDSLGTPIPENRAANRRIVIRIR